MRQFIGFFEAKKRYIKEGVVRNQKDEYENKEQQFNPLSMVKPSYPVTFMLDGRIEDAKQVLEKQIEAVTSCN